MVEPIQTEQQHQVIPYQIQQFIEIQILIFLDPTQRLENHRLILQRDQNVLAHHHPHQVAVHQAEVITIPTQEEDKLYAQTPKVSFNFIYSINSNF